MTIFGSENVVNFLQILKWPEPDPSDQAEFENKATNDARIAFSILMYLNAICEFRVIYKTFDVYWY